MPLQDVIGFMSGDPTPWRAAHTSYLLDATAEKFAYIFQVPKTGNIDRVGFRTGTVTTSNALTVGIQTLTGDAPSGSAYGGSAAGSQATVATDTYYEVTLATPAAATRGDWVAVVIQFTAWTTGNLNIVANEAWFNQNFPYVSHFTAAWAKGGKHPCGHVRYDDGTYPQIFAVPSAAWSFPSYDTGTTPDERGLKFKVPISCAIKGAWCRVGPGTGGWSLILYDSDGTTALTTQAVAATASFGTGNDPIRVLFDADVILAPNVFYRLAVLPTSLTNVDLAQFTVNTAAMLDGFPGGQNFHLTTRTDAGAWTDTTTARSGLEPFFVQLHDGSPMIMTD